MNKSEISNSNKKNKLVAVCIDHHSKITSMIRSAKRKAKELGVDWIAIHVNSTYSRHLSARNKINLLNNIELVRTLGGELVELEDSENSISKTITKYVKDSFGNEKPIRHLIIGYNERSKLYFLKKPLSEKVVKSLRGICEVQITPIKSFNKHANIRQVGKTLIISILCGILMPLLSYVLISTIKDLFSFGITFINYYNIFIIYLIAIVFTSLRWGLLSGLMSAVLSFVIVNFIHLNQINNFNLSIIALAVNFMLFIGISLVVSILGYSSNFHKIGNLTKDRALKVINKISQIKFSAASMSDLSILICKRLEESLSGNFSISLIDGGNKIINYGDIQIDNIYDEKIKAVLDNTIPQAIYEANKITYFQPMSVIDKDIGVLIAQVSPRYNIMLNLQKILPVISDQISIILNNFEIKMMLEGAKINEEREKLRSLILSSISHDLKTPLSSIIGSLNIFNKLNSKHKLNKQTQETLISTALEEAEKLNGFISEVLEMTRIESGAIRLQKQLLNPFAVIEKTLKRFELKLKHYQIEVRLDKDIQVNFDLVSFEQIIQNLIDNTMKYVPRNTKIAIYDELSDDSYKIFIEDQGGGIEESKLELIFNKFERFALEDKVLGSGLGLSIVKALMELNQASISVKNSTGKIGAIFILKFNDFIKLT